MALARLADLKRAGTKIVAVVCWDTPMARIADAAGVDLVSVGDSVGVNLWGQKPGEITVDELLIVARAVRRGVKRALVSCDLPENASPREAIRLMRDARADLVKMLASPDIVREVAKQGVPVFAEMHGDKLNPDELVALAKQLEAAGAHGGVGDDDRDPGILQGGGDLVAVSPDKHDTSCFFPNRPE